MTPRTAPFALMLLLSLNVACAGTFGETPRPERAAEQRSTPIGPRDQVWGEEEDLTEDPFRADGAKLRSEDPIGEFIVVLAILALSVGGAFIPLLVL